MLAFTLTAVMAQKPAQIKFCLSLYIAIPRRMRTAALFGKIFSTVKLVWLMLKNILKMDLKSREFLHTTHGDK